MRTFVAVELPPDVRARVAAAAAKLLDGVRAAKPVPPSNLHVTVRFVGEVAETSMDALQAAVRDAAASVASSTAEARGLGAFPNVRRPRVVWAGVEDASGTLAAVESAVSSRLAALGWPREERPFSAHVTVARLREGAGDLRPLTSRLEAAAGESPTFGALPIEEVTVFRSDPAGGGPRYTALARHPLSRSER